MYDPLPAGGWAVSVSDITPLAKAEDEAQRRARLLDSVLRAVPHGICVYGPDRRVAMFNQTYLDVMVGAPLDIGDHLADVVRRRAEAGEYGGENRTRSFCIRSAARKCVGGRVQTVRDRRSHRSVARRGPHQRGD